MINHARTLLLNRQGEAFPVAGVYEPYIPPFKPVPLNNRLSAADRVLFADAFGRLGRDYKVTQYLSLIQSTEFRDYLYTFDKRITYSPDTPTFSDQDIGNSVLAASEFMAAELKIQEDRPIRPGELTYTVSAGPEVYSYPNGYEEIRIAIRDQSNNVLFDDIVGSQGGTGEPVSIPNTAHSFLPLWSYPIFGGDALVDVGGGTDGYYFYANPTYINNVLSFERPQIDPDGIVFQYKPAPVSGWTTKSDPLIYDQDSVPPTTVSGYEGYRMVLGLVNGGNPIFGLRLKQTLLSPIEVVISLQRRPQERMSGLMAALEGMGGPVLDYIFGRPAQNEYKVFYNLFKRHPLHLYRIVGFLLAYIYRLNEVSEGGVNV